MMATCTLCGSVFSRPEIIGADPGVTFAELGVEVMGHLSECHRHTPQFVSLNGLLGTISVTLASMSAESADERWLTVRRVLLEQAAQTLATVWAALDAVPGGVPVAADSGTPERTASPLVSGS